MTATLLHGDCLELMKTLPNKSVDCFICDLPYGQLAPNKGGKLDDDKYGKGRMKAATELCDWDVKLDLEQFWTQVKRLAKDDHTPVLMFCNTKFGYELIKSNESWFRYDLVWNKMRGVSFLTSNKLPMKSHEMVYVFSKKGAFYKRVDEPDETMKARKAKDGYSSKCRTNVPGSGLIKVSETKGGTRVSLSVLDILTPPRTGKDRHPTEKPLDLYKWLLERYVPTGGTVLDPTAGSFNSVRAAVDLGLTAIGMEKDDTFYERARKLFETQSTPAPPETPPVNEIVYE
jgi:site-specific DNA-methyltransferase (adenine-specific)